MSKDKPLSSRAAALPESFLASVVGAPPSLQAAVIDVEMDKLPARALLDTGATESYIHEESVKKLKLKSQGEYHLRLQERQRRYVVLFLSR